MAPPLLGRLKSLLIASEARAEIHNLARRIDINSCSGSSSISSNSSYGSTEGEEYSTDEIEERCKFPDDDVRKIPSALIVSQMSRAKWNSFLLFKSSAKDKAVMSSGCSSSFNSEQARERKQAQHRQCATSPVSVSLSLSPPLMLTVEAISPRMACDNINSGRLLS